MMRADDEPSSLMKTGADEVLLLMLACESRPEAPTHPLGVALEATETVLLEAVGMAKMGSLEEQGLPS